MNHALQSFHSYLVRQHGFAELEGNLSDGADARVDANLISEHEFGFISHHIRQRFTARHARYCHIAALIGFRGKLRRSEAWGLLLSDWRDRNIPEILCQPNHLRKLKTLSSRRRIHLDGHFTDSEIELVREHVREISEIAARHDIKPDAMPLFPPTDGPLPSGGTEIQPMEMRLLIDPIEEAMRRITGDSTLRYHHLRHSGANIEMSLCLSDDIPGTAHMVVAKNENTKARSARLRKALLNNEQARHPLLWSVSSAIGHASPDTTISSYLHLCDWWLFWSCLSRKIELNDRLLACLADISISILRVRRHRDGVTKNGISDLPSLLASQHTDLTMEADFSARFRPLPESPPPPIAPVSNFSQSRLPPSQFLSFLSRMEHPAPDGHASTLRFETLNLGIEAPTLNEWRRRATELSQLPSGNYRKKRLMHTTSGVNIWRMFHRPLRPRLEQEYLQADRLYDAILAVGRDAPDAMRAWLEEFVRCRIVDFNGVWLVDPEKALGWLDILDKIITAANADFFIEPHELISALVYHHPTRQSWLSAEEQQQYWPSPPRNILVSDVPVTIRKESKLPKTSGQNSSGQPNVFGEEQLNVDEQLDDQRDDEQSQNQDKQFNVRLAGGSPVWGALMVWLAPPLKETISDEGEKIIGPHSARVSSTALNAAVFTVLCTAEKEPHS